MADTGQDWSIVSGGGVRPLRIGVTGHRPSGLTGADLATLRGRVREVLALARDSAGARDLEIMSPLAEGADQVVARAALAAGLTLICPLPFDRDTYAADFSTASSRAEYRALLTAAVCVVELDGLRTTPKVTEAGYAAVGAWMLDHCDVMLAIWDGGPPRGAGGTGQVVQEALDRRIPVVRIDARRPHDVQVLTTGSNRTVVAVALDRLPEWIAANGRST